MSADERRAGAIDRRRYDEEVQDERRTGEPDRRDYSIRHRIGQYFLGDKRGYRDVWLIGITFFVWLSFHVLTNNRVEATESACMKSNEQTVALNGLTTALQGMVLSGAALAGDQPSPNTDPLDPSAWKTLRPGPLSRQLERQFPDLPTAQERLDQAKRNAASLEARKVQPRDCKYEIGLIRGDVTATPTPSPSATP